VLEVIDEAAGTAKAEAALEESRRGFFALRSQLRELDGRLQGRDALTVQLQDVRRTSRRGPTTLNVSEKSSTVSRNTRIGNSEMPITSR